MRPSGNFWNRPQEKAIIHKEGKAIDLETAAREVDRDVMSFLEDSDAKFIVLFKGGRMAEKIAALDSLSSDEVERFIQVNDRFVPPDYRTDLEKGLAFLKSLSKQIQNDPRYNQ